MSGRKMISLQQRLTCKKAGHTGTQWFSVVTQLIIVFSRAVIILNLLRLDTVCDSSIREVHNWCFQH